MAQLNQEPFQKIKCAKIVTSFVEDNLQFDAVRGIGICGHIYRFNRIRLQLVQDISATGGGSKATGRGVCGLWPRDYR